MLGKDPGNLARPGAVPHATEDGFVYIKITVSDLDVEATIGIGANPCLVMDRRPLAAKV